MNFGAVVIGFNSPFRTSSKVLSACWIANIIVSSNAKELDGLFGGSDVVVAVEFESMLLFDCFGFMYVSVRAFFAEKC